MIHKAISDILIDKILPIAFKITESKVLASIASIVVLPVYLLVGAVIGIKNGFDYFVIEWWRSYVIRDKAKDYLNELSDSNPADLKNANCAIFDVSKMLPDLEHCKNAADSYADLDGTGQYGLVRKSFNDGINWALNFITKQK